MPTSPAQPQTSVHHLPDTDPPYHVILLDDDDHTYAYVIEMLMAIFGHEFHLAQTMAETVDHQGRVIVATVHRELAELRKEQIETYGPDPRISSSPGSMSAQIEAAA
ncbi:MAG: ATP-dependent Clp protease adaptor ClpS [Verrucomicrobiales bacterium]|nr:ATP-dependent Clp protease adaptor ClpS [Verrucomicrobiales bacterium]